MKKSLILVGMLAVGYANAQVTDPYEGKVGVNVQEPKATLDIAAYKTDGSTTEGLLIPRLAKEAVIKMTNPEISTLVYVTDEVLESDNAKFQGTGKGFYFYNGTKWVKQLDTDSITQSEELWATDGTEYYLKASKDGDNSFGMIKREDNTSTFLRVAGMENLSVAPYRVDNLSTIKAASGDFRVLTSQVLQGGNANFSFNRNYIEPTHVARTTNLNYTGQHNGLYVNEDTGKDLGTLITLGNITRIGNTSSNLAQNVTNLYGLSNITDFYSSGKVTLLTGSYNVVRNQNKGGTVETLRAGRFLAQNASTATNVDGILVESTLSANATSTTLTGVNSFVTLHTGSTVTDVYGYKFSRSVNSAANITNAYGLYIDNVNFGKDKNFSIYTKQGIAYIGDKLGVGTETPTQRIEANGNIFANNGGLMSSRSNPTGGYVELINPLKTSSTTEAEEGAENTETTNVLVSNWRIYNMAAREAPNDYRNGLHFWGIGKGSVMVLTDEGNVGIGFAAKESATSSVQTNEKFEVNGNIRSVNLAGTGNRNVYADEKGVLRVGEAVANNGATKIGTTAGLECNEENRGMMNFDRTTLNGEETDVIGFCMKNSQGVYKWMYLSGGASITSGSSVFGQ